MRIELIRNSRLDRSWPATDRLLADLIAGRVTLQPGDKIFVHEEPGGSHLRLVVDTGAAA